MIRKRAFWALDRLKGGNIRGHFMNIQYILEKYDDDSSKAHRKKLLKSILNHAIKNTVFYSTYQNYSSLNDFPVINKTTLRNHYEHFQARAGFREPKHQMSTSGSTGTPFKVSQDHTKKERNTADTIYYGQKGGYSLGQPLYYLRKWDSTNYKSPITKRIQNVVPVNVTKFNSLYLKNTLTKMSKESSSFALIGYPSAFKDLCSHIRKTGFKLRTNISSIITIAEALGPKTKMDMESFFKADVISRYSNAENGIIAQQISGMGDDFHINWASYFMEILEIDSNRPAKYGRLGRIVITDLFNYCMPMIRYDTGDLGIMNTSENPFNNAPVLKKIEGRKMDFLFDTQGNRTTPYLAYELESFPELKQFQVIQEGKKDYNVLLNIQKAFNNEKKARTKLKKHLGSDANIYFSYVDEIPRLSSGKRKLTLNKYYLEENA